VRLVRSSAVWGSEVPRAPISSKPDPRLAITAWYECAGRFQRPLTAGIRAVGPARSKRAQPRRIVACGCQLKDGSELREQLLGLSDLEQTFTILPIRRFPSSTSSRMSPGCVTDGDRTFWQWESAFHHSRAAHRGGAIIDLVASSLSDRSTRSGGRPPSAGGNQS